MMIIFRQKIDNLTGHKYIVFIFLVTFISLNLILGSLIYLRYRNEVSEELNQIEEVSLSDDLFSKELIIAKLNSKIQGVSTLSTLDYLTGIFNSRDLKLIDKYLQNISKYVDYDNEITKITLLDVDGNEIVATFNTKNGTKSYWNQSQKDNLRNDVIENLKSVESGETFLSELCVPFIFDGNETRLIPSLFIGNSVEDKTGKRLGYVLLYFNGNILLDEIEQHNDIEYLEKTLVTSDGMWFRRSNLRDERIVLGGLKHSDFGRFYPEELELMKNTFGDQMYTVNGFFSYINISAVDFNNTNPNLLIESDMDHSFFILTHMNKRFINKIKVDTLKELSYIPITAFLTISIFSYILAFTMNNSRDYKMQMKYDAERDVLTGIYNRREGFAILESQILACKRKMQSLTLAYIDVDNLKKVNDEFGHSEGDYLIKKTTEIIQLFKRESDVLARVGGDEFILILPECGQKDAEVIFDKIQKKITNYNKTSSKEYEVSISFGLAEFDSVNPIHVDDLIQTADKHMYKQKEEKKRQT